MLDAADFLEFSTTCRAREEAKSNVLGLGAACSNPEQPLSEDVYLDPECRHCMIAAQAALINGDSIIHETWLFRGESGTLGDILSYYKSQL